MAKRNFYTTILCLFLVAFNVPLCGMKENEDLNDNDQQSSLQIQKSQRFLCLQRRQNNNPNIVASSYGDNNFVASTYRNNNEETKGNITNSQVLPGPQIDNPDKGTSDDCDINRLINKDPLKNTLNDIKGIVTNSPIDISVDCKESEIILRRLFVYNALKCKAICSYLKTYDCIIKKHNKSGKTVEISGDEYIKELENIENRNFLDLSITGKATKKIDKLFVTYLKHDGHIKRDVDAKLSLHKKINEEFCRKEINSESSDVKRRRVCYLNDLDLNSRRKFLYTQHELLLRKMLGDHIESETEHLEMMLYDIDFYHRYSVGKEIEYYYDQSMIPKKNYLWISLYRCGSKTIGSLLWSIINSLCNFEKNVVNSTYTFLPFLCFGYKWQPECMAANGSFIDVNINLAGGFVNCFISYIFLGKNESIFSLKNIKLLIYSSFNVNLNIKIANDFYMAINICGLLQALFFSFNEMKKDNIHVCEECKNIILQHQNDEKLKSINEGGALYNENIASNNLNESEQHNDNNSEHNYNNSEHNGNNSEKGGDTNEFIIDTIVPEKDININIDNDNKA